MVWRMEQFNAGMFAAYRGTGFLFRAVDRTERAARLELVDVRGGDDSIPHGRLAQYRAPFSLLFVLQEDIPLGPGLQRLDHADFAPCDLLLTRVAVPGGAGGRQTGAFYEAVFG
jgi:hypothetical protein